MPCHISELGERKCWDNRPVVAETRSAFDGDIGARMLHNLMNDPPVLGFGILFAVVVLWIGYKIYNSRQRQRGGYGGYGGPGGPGGPAGPGSFGPYGHPPRYQPFDDQDDWGRR